MKSLIYLSLIFLSLSGINLSFAQQITIKGSIRDSLQQPLENANIIAIGNTNKDLRFAISNHKGLYKLNLLKDQDYTITASYLGFHKQEFTVLAKEDITHNFTLDENNEQLNEVIITPPVIFKKDTIIYNADSFTNGRERKLKQVLEKLPGIDVDRKGNITVQGKKVKKFLVEGKRFFTGDPKLGVNNIPADAVNKIEVLYDHSDIAFLKGLEDNDDIALNIKLKEDKKNFFFGDTEAASGVAESENYLFHPNLFYYSPKTTINALADINNLGTKSFTLREYVEYEGGFSKIAKDANKYFDLYNSDFAQFLSSQNYFASKHLFGALNITHSINKKLDLSSYVITSSSDNDTKTNTLNNYFLNENNLTELRSTQGSIDNNFSLGKLNFNYKPNSSTEMHITMTGKTTNNNYNSLLNTISADTNFIETNHIVTNTNIKQSIELHKQFNASHTLSTTSIFQYIRDNTEINWLTNQELFNNLLPLVDDDNYNINQLKQTNTHNLALTGKHYWVLNRYNHIYTTLGINYTLQNLISDEFQLIDSSQNNFSSANFGYNNSYVFNDTYLGIQYKFKKGLFIIKPGLFLHNYIWNANKNKFNNQIKTLILPQLDTDLEIKKSEKISLNYKLATRFANPINLVNAFSLRSFNTVFQGNSNLENILYHQASLSYFKFSFYRGIQLNLGLNYIERIKNIQSNTTQQGINQINSLIETNNPENNASIYGSLFKTINNYKFGINADYNQNKYTQLINSGDQINKSKITTIGISLRTKFKDKYPNINIKQENSYNKFKSGINSSLFTSRETLFELNYIFLKDFELIADYSYIDYRSKDQTIKNFFNIANASLSYQKENKPWGFELTATNMFNIKFKSENSFSSIVVSNTQTFVLPRIISFKVIYKL